jgi:hypothetical protein
VNIPHSSKRRSAEKMMKKGSVLTHSLLVLTLLCGVLGTADRPPVCALFSAENIIDNTPQSTQCAH